MSLGINNNLFASNVARHLQSNYASLSVSTQRLSSGLRINSAADDAAGLAIRELMRAEFTSMRQGIRNANDAISLIQTADGALAVIDEKLIRMKELAVQASTGTYNSDQRLIIDSEYQAMASEISRIANATKFNGIYLLNGNLSSRPEDSSVADWHRSHSGSEMNPSGPLKVHFGSSNNSSEDYYYIQISSATPDGLGLVSEESEYEFRNLSGAEIMSRNPTLAVQGSLGWSPGDIFHTLAGADAADFPNQTAMTFTEPSTGSGYLVMLDNNGVQRSLRYQLVPIAYLGEGNIIVRDDITTTNTVRSSISTQELAQSAIMIIDNAIKSKDHIRSNLGALQNRLQNTIANLSIQSENILASKSRLSDADIALEMTTFVRNQIATQAATAMLAQANSLPRMALDLISG